MTDKNNISIETLNEVRQSFNTKVPNYNFDYGEYFYQSKLLNKNTILNYINNYLETNKNKMLEKISKYNLTFENWYIKIDTYFDFEYPIDSVALVNFIFKEIGAEALLSEINFKHQENGTLIVDLNENTEKINYYADEILSISNLKIACKNIGFMYAKILKNKFKDEHQIKQLTYYTYGNIFEKIAFNLIFSTKEVQFVKDIYFLEHMRLLLRAKFENEVWYNLSNFILIFNHLHTQFGLNNLEFVHAVIGLNWLDEPFMGTEQLLALLASQKINLNLKTKYLKKYKNYHKEFSDFYFLIEKNLSSCI